MQETEVLLSESAAWGFVGWVVALLAAGRQLVRAVGPTYITEAPGPPARANLWWGLGLGLGWWGSVRGSNRAVKLAQ